MTGERFGCLVVIAKHTVPNRDRRYPWRCRCDCGNERLVAGNALKGGKVVQCTRSCRARFGFRTLTRRSPTYCSWIGMFQRCENPENRHYKSYGARGIAVCDRWRESFENFLADMGERPKGTTLDRIDNDRGYEPANCRWATQREQNRNTRRSRLTPDLVQEVHGRCEHGESQTAVAKRFGIHSATVSQIRRGLIWSDQLGGPS